MLLTKEQRKAVHALWKRDDSKTDNWGIPTPNVSYLTFRRRVRYDYLSDFAFIPDWNGMFIGIELDGYTHS